ncbi:MAG: HAMP domain-containing sensor histidine kinase [Pseudomonadota bacterium]
MKKLLPIIFLVITLLASSAILTLWIVWYISVNNLFGNLFEKYGIEPSYYTSVLWLLQGIFLVVFVIAGAITIFVYWTRSKSLDNMRMAFISGVSHELLTPLSSLKLYIETMLLRNINKERQQEFLNLMLEDTDILADHISKILLASKLERKKAVYTFKTVNMTDYITDYLSSNKNNFKKSKITFRSNSKNIFSKIDTAFFNIVLRNIIDNAIKYGPNKTTIKIELNKKNNKNILSISDNGPGIEEKRLKKIFSLFYRINHNKKGTGLGLYIVKTLVKAHKGNIWAINNIDNKGITINISLKDEYAKDINS